MAVESGVARRWYKNLGDLIFLALPNERRIWNGI